MKPANYQIKGGKIHLKEGDNYKCGIDYNPLFDNVTTKAVTCKNCLKPKGGK